MREDYLKADGEGQGNDVESAQQFRVVAVKMSATKAKEPASAK